MCVRVCVREGERQRDNVAANRSAALIALRLVAFVCAGACVLVCVRRMYVYMCVDERETHRETMLPQIEIALIYISSNVNKCNLYFRRKCISIFVANIFCRKCISGADCTYCEPYADKELDKVGCRIGDGGGNLQQTINLCHKIVHR